MDRLLSKIIIVALLIASPVNAAVPPQLDSLLKYGKLSTGLETAVNDTIWTWALNMAVQRVCIDFDALPKSDTLDLRQDTAYRKLNSDFLRVDKVFKMFGNETWAPMLEVNLDTLMRQITDSLAATKDFWENLEPRRWFWHDDMFTHPRLNDSFLTTLLVTYWASDAWLSDSTGSTDSTLIQLGFRDAIIDWAAYLIFRSRDEKSRMDHYLESYNRRLQ